MSEDIRLWAGRAILTIRLNKPHPLVLAPRHCLGATHPPLPPRTPRMPPARGTGSVCMQGNCTTPPAEEFLTALSGAAMLPLKPGQCIILAHEHIAPLAAGALWWDNMYLRFAGMRSTAFAGESSRRSTAPMLFHSHGGRAWVTNTTIQGDGSSPCGAIVIYPNAALQFVGAPSLHPHASAAIIPPAHAKSPLLACPCAHAFSSDRQLCPV